MQTGDTFPVYLLYKEDDIEAYLTKADDLIIAFYDYKRDLVMKGSISDGRVEQFNEGEDYQYIVNVTHKESLRMVGKVFVELTITEGNGKKVYNGDKVVTVSFEPRMNNTIIDNDEKENY
jgi:hypothetical protein